MPAIIEAVALDPPSAQVTDLCLLIDLEARWENLRIHYQLATPRMGSTRDELHQIQGAHEAFFTRLVAYNKKYQPAHVPEQLLNNARRLGVWCAKMRDLQLRIQHNPKSQYPVHLMEKAYLRADRLADRVKRDRIGRTVGSDNIQAAIVELEVLARWCDSLASAGP